MEYTENRSSKKLIIFEITCVLIIIALIGYTYSYFNVSVTNDTTISGRVASLSLTLNVSRVAPSNTNGLIPQLDQYITSAVIGRNGSCIDDNNNNVCQVYQIKVKNTSSVSLYANGTVTLDNKNNPNLKWAQISGTTSPTLVSGVNTPSTITLVQNELFTASEEKIYYIVVWISETGDVQYDTGAFTGVVTFGDASNTEPVGEPFLALNNITVDGQPSNSFPTGAYTVNTNCTTATASFDYENWRLRVSSLSTDGVADCSPTFTSKEKVYLNNKVISLAGQTVGTGQVVNENGYRYEGKNPDNYIKFNNEMWRIIGVFDATSHGQTGLNLTKIIRNESIGGYVWDKSNVNIWPNSSLYNLLNTYYYNSDNGQDSIYCYQYRNILTGHCDYTNTGIQDYYRPMIKNVTWYLGGYSSYSVTTENFFNYERSTSDDNYYSSNTGYKTTTGYIGFMYSSDYGYSVLSGSCARTTNLGSYNTAFCGGSSWLNKETNEWTLSHRSSNSSSVSNVNQDGSLINVNAYNGYSTRPTLYLDSTVYIVNGTGTESNPYIIAMD